MNNTATITLAIILCLAAEPTPGAEEYMPLAPGMNAYATPADINDIMPLQRVSSADDPTPEPPRPTLHKNVIKLTLPSPTTTTESRLRIVEIDPAIGNGVIDFNIPETTNSYIPAPPRHTASTTTPPPAQLPEDIPGLITPVQLSRNKTEPLTAEPAKQHGMASKPAAQEDIMAMAAPPLPELPVLGDPYVATLEPFLIPPEPALPQPSPVAVPEPIVSKSVSFHSRPPKPAHRELLPIPSTSAVKHQPAGATQPPRPMATATPPPVEPPKNNSDTDKQASGPLRLPIGPLVNAPGVPLNDASGTTGNAIFSAPMYAYDPIPDGIMPAALTPEEFALMEAQNLSKQPPRPTGRATPPPARQWPEPATVPAGKTAPGKTAAKNGKGKSEPPPNTPNRKKAEGFTSMRDVRNVIGPPDPKLFTTKPR